MIGKSCLYIIACVDSRIKCFSHAKTGSIDKENVSDETRNRCSTHQCQDR